MSDLEALLRAAAEAGELTHLSLVPVAGKGPRNLAWSVSYSPASTFGTGYAVHADPVEAIKLALSDKRLAKVVRKVEKVLADAPTGAVKAAAQKLGVPEPTSTYVDDADLP